MKKLILLLIIAALFLTGCEKDKDKKLCKKITNVYNNGILIDSDTTQILTFRGSYTTSDYEMQDNTFIYYEIIVDCECD